LGRFVSGNAGGPGRPKGCEDRATADAKRVKAELLGTLDELGPEAVRQLAKDDPCAYVSLIMKLLPADDPARRLPLRAKCSPSSQPVPAGFRRVGRAARCRKSGFLRRSASNPSFWNGAIFAMIIRNCRDFAVAGTI